MSGRGQSFFFLTPRLNEFPLLDPTQDILIPAQYPYSKHWGAIPASSLKGAGTGGGVVGKLKVRQPLRMDVTLANTYISHDAPIVTDPSKYNRYENIDQWGHLLEDFHPHGGRPEVDIQARDHVTHRYAQSADFASGPLGAGWRIDREGNGEMESLVLRRFLEAPEFRKNKISVIGDEFWVAAAGLIERVDEADSLPVYVKGRRALGKDGKPWRIKTGPGYIVRFKLEEGDSHAFKKDDILVSKFEQPDGFQSAWFRVLYVLSGREVFVTALNDYAPQVAMSVARQGNFTDPTRQNSIYISGKEGYIRVLSGVNSTEIRFENIRCQYGNLEGLTVDGIGALHGYGEYSDNAYKRGVFLMRGGSTIEDFVQESLDTLKGTLGGLAYQDAVEAAMCGETLIVNGYLKTSLIKVDTLVSQTELVEKLIASEAFINQLATNEAFINSLVVRRLNATNATQPKRTVQIEPDFESIVVRDGNGKAVILIDDGSLDISGNSEPRIDLFGNSYNGGTPGWARLEPESLKVGYSSFESNGITMPKGANVNMPGVLAAGKVKAQGAIDKQWGCKRCVIEKYYGEVGKYAINHNIGHTNYFIQATPCGEDDKWAKVHAIILKKENTRAVVAIYDSGTNNTGVDTDFEFLIVGDK